MKLLPSALTTLAARGDGRRRRPAPTAATTAARWARARPGRAGAFVARADDPTAVAYNPAGLAKIGGTDRSWSATGSRTTATRTRARRRWTGATPAERHGAERYVRQGAQRQAVAGAGAAARASPRTWACATGASRWRPSRRPGEPSRRGDFPLDGGQRYMMLSREAIILNYTATAAWKYHDLFGVGVTLRVDPRAAARLLAGDRRHAVRRRGQPGVEPPRHAGDDDAARIRSRSTRSSAPGSARCRSCEFGARGAGGAGEHRDQQHAGGARPSTRRWATVDADARRHARQRRQRHAAAAADRARVGARYRHLARTRELFDVELDVEYETWSRVNDFTRRHPRPGGGLPGRDGRPEPDRRSPSTGATRWR